MLLTTKAFQVSSESNSYCQSTPAPSRLYSNILDYLDSFDKTKTMSSSDPPSPIASNQAGKHGNKNEAKKPTMVEMICKAIENLGNGRKGSSVPAIKKWIMGTYSFDTDGAVNVRIRKALAKGLESGILDRSTKSAQLTGAKGFFIVKPKPKEKPKVAKAKKPTGSQKGKAKPNYASDSEVTIIKSDKRKSTKMHASDTDLPSDTEPLKPKKKKIASKEPKKQKENKGAANKPTKPKDAKAKPVKPDAAKAKEKKTEGEKAKKEKPVKKPVPKPKKDNDEAKSSGKKAAKK